jgi:cell division septum initiation protein DivIVA
LKIPRDYVSNLEEQVARLTQEIQDLRERARGNSAADGNVASTATASRPAHETGIPHSERQSASDESSPLFQDLVTSVKNVVVEPSQQPRFLGQSSGISFAKMVMAAINVDDLLPPLVPEQQPFREISVSTPANASLPPRPVADHLVDVYFQYRTPHLPILDRSQVGKAIDSAYRSLGRSQESVEVPKRDMFMAYMVFAIALVDVQHTSGGRPGQSEGCFRSALGWVEKILTYSKSDLETLRIVLLLAQFVALSPSRGSLWHLTGFALRLCIDVGLHWENELQCLNMDPDVLDDRRRLWHCTYHFDRLLCITLGRPFGILDESTRVQIPNPWTGSRQGLGRQQPSDFDIHTQRAHNHLFTLARLESEIKHVQHSQVWALKLAYPRPNWTAWLQDIQPRLQEWYATVPEPSKAHPSSIFAFQAYWEVIYYNAILLLYRPQSGTLYQSTEELSICFNASSRVIAGLKVLQREGRVEMLWKSVHHLFMAGLGVIYGLWHSKEIRDQNPVGTSISTLHSCASTLAAMSETFQGAAGCRNAFDTLSSATIDWLVTRDIEEVQQTRLEFENHVRELTNQLQLSREGPTASIHHRADNMSAMLSTDNVDLSELLNTAAQWPDLGEFNFVMGEQDAMMDTALDPTATGAMEQLPG